MGENWRREKPFNENKLMLRQAGFGLIVFLLFIPYFKFAAFVSSIIETGTPASKMSEIRNTFHDLDLPTYDVLSPELMDLISIKVAKLKGTYSD
ncbi:hypothetical protein MKY84_13750 [Chryseomicrobium sp. FSL W7-1435]|uniref:hypothetical protein n=1 Tax=Chryseomicrobium sp. FSL W7-1435 TaxID=2921704 RepID=UPI00315A31C6